MKGILLFINNFLKSPDPNFVHIALWTLVQLLKGKLESVFKMFLNRYGLIYCPKLTTTLLLSKLITQRVHDHSRRSLLFRSTYSHTWVFLSVPVVLSVTFIPGLSWLWTNDILLTDDGRLFPSLHTMQFLTFYISAFVSVK